MEKSTGISEIKNTLTKKDIGKIPTDRQVYGVKASEPFYWGWNVLTAYDVFGDGSRYYRTKEEAIEASKLLFGIK